MCSSSGANSLEVEKLDTTLLFVWVLIVVRYKYRSKRQVTSGFDLTVTSKLCLFGSTVTSNYSCLDRVAVFAFSLKEWYLWSSSFTEHERFVWVKASTIRRRRSDWPF